MRKSLNYALMLGASLLVATGAIPVKAEGIKLGSDGGVNPADVYTYMVSSIGFPVLDITSVPAHAIVALEQQFVRLETEKENALKQDVKHRLSQIENAVNMRGRLRLLSQVEVNPAKDMGTSWSGIKEGFIDVNDEIEAEGKATTVAQTQEQQKKWTSAAGTLKTQTDYELKRQYEDQEYAIRMMAQALVLKQQAFEKLKKLNDELNSHYSKTDVPENLKGSGVVKGSSSDRNGSDYNKALREYAYQSLIYDQLLSMEQQILGMRLQTRGSLHGQGLQAVSDDLETRGIMEEGK